ncbi:hypothetical protein N9Z54_08525 [Planctomycetota bacterium]|jgi:hypothetical protein|nr:hypothetical protein [Planctomycetota bacterium]
MKIPTRDELRAELAGFDETRKKVIGGMLAIMFQSPEKARDRGWLAEQFTQVALLTGQFEAVEHAHEGVEVAQAWIRSNIDPVLNACFALFIIVAEDVQGDEAAKELTTSDAMLRALAYFA